MANVCVYPKFIGNGGTPDELFIPLEVTSLNVARFTIEWHPNFSLSLIDLYDSLRDEIKTQANSHWSFTPTDAEILIFGMPFKP